LEKEDPAKKLKELGGILVPGGFGDRGIEGKILAAKFARETGVPYLGLCLGMQIAAIEFARDVLGIAGANSAEFAPNTGDPVIHLQETQRHVKRKGGSMRLGAHECVLRPGSLAHRLYGRDSVMERHRHRYEFNNVYRERFEEAGFVISGTTPDNHLVEMIELPSHPFFIATQSHPEFLSKPDRPHPLFVGFIRAAHESMHRKPL
jgi:CTP synthase